MDDFFQLILEPMKEVFSKFKGVPSNILATLTILLAGIVFARIMKAVLLRVLRAVKFDSWSDRMGLTVVMRKGDLWAKPSIAVGSIVFWLLLVSSYFTGLG